MMTTWQRRFGFFSLFLTIITLVITIAINFRPLYVFDIHYLNILHDTTVDKTTLLKNFDKLMAFLNNPFASQLTLPDFPMSEAGRGHFIDVKKLFLLNYAVFLITIIPSIVFLVKLKKQQSLWRLILPFKFGMIIPVILGFVMATGFDRFFVTFHELFFQNDDWLFDPKTDPIINVLPESFFMHCFILAFVLLELCFLALVLWGNTSLRKKTTRLS
ncbi:membrane protein [Enterococcus saigonensis]|uniref:Membrane protein n=1 Tax=Enterococcus saigonensis TaxID=1805431 RepID=A0A679I661_9ENTE|nr:TIGR01906 family membrane protein [Enterococcus saigonensis]BCA85058.1 membrane protein [Enterococcus saigonensis]